MTTRYHMELTPEHVEFLTDHKFSILSTGRRDGSPQASMVGHTADGNDVLVTFRRSSAKYNNIRRQPRVVLSVPDGRRVLTIYGEGELVESDPARVEGYARILAAYGAPEQSPEQLAKSLDDEHRVVLRIRPTAVELHN
jgi:PPOX class probable F420-dependent enzyme